MTDTKKPTRTPRAKPGGEKAVAPKPAPGVEAAPVAAAPGPKASGKAASEPHAPQPGPGHHRTRRWPCCRCAISSCSRT